ncbi:MAG: DMT family transporter [Micrococcales bacterium]|nr:DMT family transporter [Micrococcales bacterium]
MRTASRSSRTVTLFAVVAAVLMGFLVATQSRLNGELGRQLGDGFTAALISFGGGLVLLAVGMLASRRGRAGLREVAGAVRSGSMPWWYAGGGAAGAFLVLCQGLTAAALGVALFTVAIVCGQTIGAAVIDRVGLGTLRAARFTLPRVAGTLLAVAAVLYAVSARVQSDVPIWMLVLPFVAGVGTGWQQAVNGQVRGRANSALTATFVNFVVGTSVLLVATLVHAAIAQPTLRVGGSWWLYLGGPIGVVFIAGASVIVHRIGVLILGLATISGQLVASVLLDLIVPVPGREILASTVVGTALTLVATAVAAIPGRRRERTPPVAGAAAD